MDYEYEDEKFTEYFRLFKDVKRASFCSPEFLTFVEKYANLRIYNNPATRAAILK